MINHVVLFKLKECAAHELQEQAETFKRMLLALPPHIAEIKHMEVGLNHHFDGETFHLCLISHFESLDDLKVYATHPEHLKVTDYVKDKIAKRAAVDFEF
ncbi:MAG: Dabb family protein [Mangrovibacterium sp.]